MPDVAFVISPRQPYPLRELVETLRYELDLQGIPTSVSADGFPAPRSDLVYALVDPRTFVLCEGLEALPDEMVLRRTVLVGAQPPGSIADDEHAELLRSGGVVFDIDGRAVAAMRRLGIEARALTPGYCRLRDHYEPDRRRPIDVMFIGTHSTRRAELLRRYAPVLSRHNCLLHLARDGGSSSESPSFLGEDRWPLMAQTKILINLHRDEGLGFEWSRAVDAIHAGAVVVSEPAAGTAALEPGRHLLVADAGSLPYVVDELLGDERRLAQIRADAYERLRSWVPFALPASIFRAAVIELLGRPLHADVALRRGHRERTKPDSDRPSAPGRDPDLERRLASAALELDQVRGELLEVRSELAQMRRLTMAPRRAPGSGVGVRRIDESPAWGARRRPRVTVLVTYGRNRDQIARTLDCVATSRLQDLELVCVEHDADDGTRAIATRWLDAHPRIPALLVADERGRGRGAARNTGIDFARGESVLVLDPGSALYPHGLQRLADTLAAMDEVSLVYPMIELLAESEWFVDAGGEGLLNAFAWEPERLRIGNLVHAPYLIETEVLRRLGGFADNAELEGFEDYDLCCRLAEQAGRGQLLAQLLASRQELPGSSCLATIAPVPGPATQAIVSRAPRAMAGAFRR